MALQKSIIVSAPSGSGKTTLINYLKQHTSFPLQFSISCTTRAPRGAEQHGREYYFLTPESFRQRIETNDFLEYNEVFGQYYGTLKSEETRIAAMGCTAIFDVDVDGAQSIKKYFGERALALFIAPPSLEVLSQRLHQRGTESEEKINSRLARASYELSQAEHFDHIIVNDDLLTAETEFVSCITAFLQS